MIGFVNAKVNIGLQIVRRREDGYHDLQTVFYPVGLYAGAPENPESFCDILEIVPSGEEGVRFMFTGRKVDCPREDNLVCRAVSLFEKRVSGDGRVLIDSLQASGVHGAWRVGLDIRLDKHLPDGAGMGGGSADASFTLRMLNTMLAEEERFTDSELAGMALELGADCPFFIYNRPMYGEGVGEKLSDIPLDLSGYWLVSVKPEVHVSTREAFAGVTPHEGNVDLRKLPSIPVEQWQSVVKNDFEDSIFPQYPVLRSIKESLISSGALYASMSGSGSSVYGIFKDLSVAHNARCKFLNESTIEGAYLLKL